MSGNLKDNQMSRWPDVVLLSSIRCLSLGIHMIKCQPDLLDYQISRWLYIVLFLATRCLYGRLHLTECQPDPKDEQMSKWPDLVPFLAMKCLYKGWMFDWISAWHIQWPFIKMTWCSTILGHEMPLPRRYIWLNVRLTQRITRCQDDLM